MYLKLLEKYNGRLRNDEYWICCPFHLEKKPSMSVNIDSGVFFCFGCRRNGWIHEIIAEIEGITLSEAFKLVNNTTGSRKRYSRREHRDVVNFLDKSILDNFDQIHGREYKDYLKSRGIKFKVAKEFGLREGNLLQREWNNRIIFPIYNLDGGLVSIVGRSINGSSLRYYNYSGSKSSAGLFGIDKIRLVDEIFEDEVTGWPITISAKENIVFIVEGFIDCLSMIQCGFYSLAMGTLDLSDLQIIQLRQITEFPVVILDGHDGSKKAIADRNEIEQRFRKKLASHFKKYLIVTIDENNQDPNDLYLQKKLKPYVNSVYNKIMNGVF